MKRADVLKTLGRLRGDYTRRAKAVRRFARPDMYGPRAGARLERARKHELAARALDQAMADLHRLEGLEK